jgi:hypothetical protein
MGIDLFNTKFRRNVDIGTLNKDEKVRLIWSVGVFAVKVRMNMKSNFETSQGVHKIGEIQVE